MKTKKQYCEENGLDIDRVFDMCVSGAGRLHERGEPVLLKQISI